MKKIICIFILLLLTNFSLAAMSGDSGNNQDNLYKTAKKLIIKAKKLEKKDKVEKALKLYSKAYDRLIKAYEKDNKNPDILNYLGYILRKKGDFEKGEEYYLLGLQIDPDHKGINEYLGELYVVTDRIDLAKERLSVLKNCNCEEYKELKEIIEGKKKSKY